VDAPLIDGPLPVLLKAAPLEAGPIDGSPVDVPPLDALPCAPAPEEETPRPELDSPPMPVGERALEHPISQALISTRVPIVDVPEKRSRPIVTSLVPFRRLGQADFLLAPARHLAEGALHRVAPRRRDGAEPLHERGVEALRLERRDHLERAAVRDTLVARLSERQQRQTKHVLAGVSRPRMTGLEQRSGAAHADRRGRVGRTGALAPLDDCA
jgi:hypothetical protein